MIKSLSTTFIWVTCIGFVTAQPIQIANIKKTKVKPYLVTGEGMELFSVNTIYRDIVQLSPSRFAFFHELGLKKSHAYVFNENFDLLGDNEDIFFPEGASFLKTKMMSFSPEGNIFSIKKTSAGFSPCILRYRNTDLDNPTITELGQYEKDISYEVVSSHSRNSVGALFYGDKTLSVVYYSFDKSRVWTQNFNIRLEGKEFFYPYSVTVDDNGHIHFILNVTLYSSSLHKVSACIVSEDGFNAVPLHLPPNTSANSYNVFSTQIDDSGNMAIIYHTLREQYRCNTSIDGNFKVLDKESPLLNRYTFPIGKNRILTYHGDEKNKILNVFICDLDGKIIDKQAIKIGIPDKKWYYSYSRFAYFTQIKNQFYLFFVSEKDNGMSYIQIDENTIGEEQHALLNEPNLNVFEGHFVFREKDYLWGRKTLTKGQTEEFVFIELE